MAIDFEKLVIDIVKPLVVYPDDVVVKILSEDERMENDLLNNLKPSWEEIKKAEKTIEILSILSEVL